MTAPEFPPQSLPKSQLQCPPRQEGELRQRQEQGELRVRVAAEYRDLVREVGLAEAYAATDVVVAADAGFMDQGCLVLSLGPTDPPIRLRTGLLAGVPGLTGCGSGELVLPIGGGLGEGAALSGAQLLRALLEGQSLPFNASGEATPLHPRRELHTELSLEQIGAGRLLLHRAISENGVVAVNRAEGPCPSPYGTLLGKAANALYNCGGAGSIGLTMPGLSLLGPGSPVLVGGGLGWVVGAGSGHQPGCKRQASGHARTPGAAAAVSVDLHALRPEWVRPCFFEGHGSALLVAIAAPRSPLGSPRSQRVRMSITTAPRGTAISSGSPGPTPGSRQRRTISARPISANPTSAAAAASGASSGSGRASCSHRRMASRLHQRHRGMRSLARPSCASRWRRCSCFPSSIPKPLRLCGLARAAWAQTVRRRCSFTGRRAQARRLRRASRRRRRVSLSCTRL